MINRRERHFLSLLDATGATISVGTVVGYELYRRGLVSIVKWGRYGITPKGIEALKQEEKAK